MVRGDVCEGPAYLHVLCAMYLDASCHAFAHRGLLAHSRCVHSSNLRVGIVHVHVRRNFNVTLEQSLLGFELGLCSKTILAYNCVIYAIYPGFLVFV